MAENVLRFGDDFHLRELRTVTKYISDKIEFRGFEDFNLDFSKTRTAFADAMLPLVALLYRYRREGIKFHVKLPINPKLQRIMLKSGWIGFITGEQAIIDPAESDLNLPAQCFSDPDSQTNAVDLLLDRVLRIVVRFERNHLRALEWALNEITDNVLTHAEADYGGFIQLVMKPNSKEIQFVVSDAGIGIPQSMRQGLKYVHSDEFALEESVKEGVTSGQGQGNGLYGTIRIATVSGGAFSINSGNAYLSLSRDGRTVVKEELTSALGTSVDCTISYARPLLLEQALNFRSKGVYVPTDIIDTHYDEDDNILHVNIARESRSIGSRLSGRLLRQKIMNIFRGSGKSQLILDCSSLGLMASSFSDELFVKILVEMGESEFGGCCKLKGVSEVNSMIIERSRAQRVRQIIADQERQA